MRRRMARRRPRLSLFWRTFSVLAGLQFACITLCLLALETFKFNAQVEHLDEPDAIVWLLCLLGAAVVSMASAAAMAQRINRPLEELSFAASRVDEGDFEASRLDERVSTSEIRQVNIGFNRMAQKLSKVDEDRALMLAGISHDLRTPLARLRLEMELSVQDEDARAHMAADIAQLDAIISKFMDYARPEHANLEAVSLAEVIDTCLYAVRDYIDMRVHVDIPDNLWVLGETVELTRVISNLLENARRYGKSAHSGLAVVEIAAKERESWVLLKIRDHGMGVADDALTNLTKPFYRGDTARTAAVGTGLGLSIVERNLQRMGGSLRIINVQSGGLAAHIRLRKAPKPSGLVGL